MYKDYFNIFPDLDRKNTPIFQGLYQVDFKQYKDRLNTLEEIKKSKDVDKAYGHTLDLHGRNIDLLRPPNMTDEEFRQFIKIKIMANRSKGDVETLNNVADFMFDEDFLGLSETWNKEIYEDVAGLLLSIKPRLLNQPEILNLAKPGGVKLFYEFFIKSDNPELYFGCATISGSDTTVYPYMAKELSTEASLYLATGYNSNIEDVTIYPKGSEN